MNSINDTCFHLVAFFIPELYQDGFFGILFNDSPDSTHHSSVFSGNWDSTQNYRIWTESFENLTQEEKLKLEAANLLVLGKFGLVRFENRAATKARGCCSGFRFPQKTADQE